MVTLQHSARPEMRNQSLLSWSVCLQEGDLVVVDGGMVSLEVKAKMGPDVKVEVVDPGIILSRANLTFKRNGRLLRARNSMLPVLSSKACAFHPCPPGPQPCFDVNPEMGFDELKAVEGDKPGLFWGCPSGYGLLT